jgi:hypothetical protein
VKDLFDGPPNGIRDGAAQLVPLKRQLLQPHGGAKRVGDGAREVVSVQKTARPARLSWFDPPPRRPKWLWPGAHKSRWEGEAQGGAAHSLARREAPGTAPHVLAVEAHASK